MTPQFSILHSNRRLCNFRGIVHHPFQMIYLSKHTGGLQAFKMDLQRVVNHMNALNSLCIRENL